MGNKVICVSVNWKAGASPANIYTEVWSALFKKFQYSAPVLSIPSCAARPGLDIIYDTATPLNSADMLFIYTRVSKKK